MTDEQMDVRLREAGERWRAVDGPVPLADRAASPRRPWLLLASAAVVIAALVAGGVALWSGRSDSPAPTAARIGTDTWLARSVVPAKKTGSLPAGRDQPLSSVHVRFRGGQVDGSDGCNAFNGRARIEDDTIVFGQLGSTLVGCLSTRGYTSGLVDAILVGTVRYSVTPVALVITKPGVGTLFLSRAEHASIGTGVWRVNAEQKAIAGRGELGMTGARTTLPGTATLRFADGRVRGSDGCNGVDGPATVRADTIVFGDRVQTEIACAGADLVDRVLTGTAHYTVTSAELAITREGVGTLYLSRAAPTRTAVPLVGTWTLTGTQTVSKDGSSGSGSSVSPTGDGPRLVIAKGTFTYAARCFLLQGRSTTGADTIVIATVHATPHSCPPATGDEKAATDQDSFARAVLAGTVRWQIDDTQLTITKGTRGLVFERSH